MSSPGAFWIGPSSPPCASSRTDDPSVSSVVLWEFCDRLPHSAAHCDTLKVMHRMGALLLLPLALSAQTRPDDLCSISGQVTNAVTGEPVRRALVYMRRI